MNCVPVLVCAGQRSRQVQLSGTGLLRPQVPAPPSSRYLRWRLGHKVAPARWGDLHGASATLLPVLLTGGTEGEPSDVYYKSGIRES